MTKFKETENDGGWLWFIKTLFPFLQKEQPGDPAMRSVRTGGVNRHRTERYS